jgi:hypothetical protein
MLVLQHFFSYLKLNETKNFNIRTAIFGPRMHQKRLAAGLRPDPLEKLTALPRLPSCFKGAASRQGGKGKEGKGREGNGREEKGRKEKERKGDGRRGEGREGRERGRGKGEGTYSPAPSPPL